MVSLHLGVVQNSVWGCWSSPYHHLEKSRQYWSGWGLPVSHCFSLCPGWVHSVLQQGMRWPPCAQPKRSGGTRRGCECRVLSSWAAKRRNFLQQNVVLWRQRSERCGGQHGETEGASSFSFLGQFREESGVFRWGTEKLPLCHMFAEVVVAHFFHSSSAEHPLLGWTHLLLTSLVSEKSRIPTVSTQTWR